MNILGLFSANDNIEWNSEKVKLFCIFVVAGLFDGSAKTMQCNFFFVSYLLYSIDLLKALTHKISFTASWHSYSTKQIRISIIIYGNIQKKVEKSIDQ